jgi:hypothetical protein
MSLYDLPEHSELEFLIGKELIQVGVGQFQVQLHFSEDLSIAVESSLEARAIDGTVVEQWQPDAPFSGQFLFSMFGKEITNYELLPENGLKLILGTSAEISIGTTDDYESYSITCGRRTIIV